MSRTAGFLVAIAVVLSGANQAAADTLPVDVPPGSVPVAFTLDDLGTTDSATVEKTAKALREAGVPEAYGFLIGSRALDDRDHSEGVRIWLRYNYQIGNHTFTHKPFEGDVGMEFFENDIVANEPVLEQFAGPSDNWHWFRYPSLSEGNTEEKREAVEQFVKDRGYRIAQVTVDYADWLFDAAYGRCLKQGQTDRIEWLKKIYLHKATYSLDEAQRNSRKLFGRDIPQIFLVHYSHITAEIMPDLLAALKARGARFITLEEAQSDPVFDLDRGLALSHGENFLNSFLLARYPPTEDATPAHGSSWKSQVKNACPEQTTVVQ